MAKKVEDVITLDDGEQPPRNPERASDALEQVTFGAPLSDTEPTIGETDAPAPPQRDARPKRRTKLELEQENARLVSEVEKARAAIAANAPSVIESMRKPLSMSFGAMFNVMATWRGEHWKQAPETCDTLADVWAPCLGPVLANRPELLMYAAAIGVTYSVVYPSIAKDKELAAQAAKKEKAPTDLTASPPSAHLEREFSG